MGVNLWGESSTEYRVTELARCLRGWINYFGISEYYRLIQEIDHWLKEQGLLSVKGLWVNIHHPTTIR